MIGRALAGRLPRADFCCSAVFGSAGRRRVCGGRYAWRGARDLLAPLGCILLSAIPTSLTWLRRILELLCFRLGQVSVTGHVWERLQLLQNWEVVKMSNLYDHNGMTRTVAKAKEQFCEIVNLASQGKKTTITRHDQPVACVVPAQRESRRLTDE